MIVIKDDVLVRKEVKERSEGFVVAAHESVSPKKIQLLATALDYSVQ